MLEKYSNIFCASSSSFGATPLLEDSRQLSEHLLILSQTEKLFDAGYTCPLSGVSQPRLLPSLSAVCTLSCPSLLKEGGISPAAVYGQERNVITSIPTLFTIILFTNVISYAISPNPISLVFCNLLACGLQ